MVSVDPVSESGSDLKVVSSEMDLAEIRLIQLVIIKESVAKGFKKNPPAPIIWEPLKVLERLLVLWLPIMQQFGYLEWIFIVHLN